MPKSTPVWIFCRTCQPLYHSLFRCGNLIFGVPLRRGNGHKGGEVKVQSPRLGGLWWSAWELEKGKLWLEYEWNHRRGGEERGKQRGEEKGGLWLNYSPHRGQQRRTFSISAQAWALTGAATCRHPACSHLGWHVWQGARATGHCVCGASIQFIIQGQNARGKKVATGATTGRLRINQNSKLFRFLCKKKFLGCALNRLKENHTTSNDDNKPKQWVEAAEKPWPQRRI